MAKILIIDDEQLTIEMLSQFLQIIGHEPVGALNCRQGWDKLAYEEPDVILLDIQLPDQNGLDMCRELRDKPDFTEMPVIMISAHAPPMLKEADEAGANDYLSKPINLVMLQTALSKVGVG